MPVLASTRGYGIVLDSYSLMTFHDDAFGSYLWTDVDDELDPHELIRTQSDGKELLIKLMLRRLF